MDDGLRQLWHVSQTHSPWPLTEVSRLGRWTF